MNCPTCGKALDTTTFVDPMQHIQAHQVSIVLSIPNVNACNLLPIIPITLNGAYAVNFNNGCAGVVPTITYTTI